MDFSCAIAGRPRPLHVRIGERNAGWKETSVLRAPWLLGCICSALVVFFLGCFCSAHVEALWRVLLGPEREQLST